MIEKDYYNGWNDEGNLDKILSCPFCGGNGELLDDGYEHPVIDENGACVDMDIFEGDTFWIECEKCGAMITGADTPEKAIEEWNKRTGSGWIPCSESLPEETDGDYYDSVIVTLSDGFVSPGVYRNQDKEWWVEDESGEKTYRSSDEVIAWQPLPDPYRPESPETRKELEEDSKGERENERD